VFLARLAKGYVTAWLPSNSAMLLMCVALAPLVVGCSGEPPLNDEGKQRLREAEEREKKFEEEAARKLEARKKRSPEEILGDDATPKNGSGSKGGTTHKSTDAAGGSATDSPAPNKSHTDLPPSSDAELPKNDRDAKNPAADGSTLEEPEGDRPPNRNAHTPGTKPTRPFDPLNPKPVTPSAVDGDSVITLDDPPPKPRNGKTAPPKTPFKSPSGTAPHGDASSLDSADSPATNGKAAGEKRAAATASPAVWRQMRGGMPAAEVQKLLGPPTRTWTDAYVLYWYYGAGASAGKVAFIGPSQQAIAWDAPLK
jgi:hypothetical protein